jgi:hypothetical protein
MTKTNFQDLNSTIIYAKKLGKSLVVLVEGRENYNIIPIARPDLWLSESVKIVWLPPDYQIIYNSFNWENCPRLLPFREEGLEKLQNFATVQSYPARSTVQRKQQ